MIRIITIAYENMAIVDALLKSVERFVTVPFEVIVWDNTPKRTAHPISSTSPHIHFVHEGQNIGFSKATNRAINYPTSSNFSHILLLNPDAVLQSTLDQNVFEKLKKASGIIGLRVFSDLTMQIRQQSARSFPNFFTSLTGREGLLTRLNPKNALSQKYLRDDLAQLSPDSPPTPVDWISGCALFCSKQDWTRIGGLDERFFLYVEDVDFGRKAAELGIPRYYYPVVDVVHFSRSTANTRPWKSDLHHHIAMYKYWWKWSSLPVRILFIFPLVGILFRYALRRLLGSLGRTAT